MVVYVITGASRGLGYEFVRQLSQDPNNLVFGLVRNGNPVTKQIQADGLNKNNNIHILEADVIDRKALEQARTKIESLTPHIDVLFNNAAAITLASAFNSLVDFTDQPDLLEQELVTNFNTNVIGVINTTNALLPLIRKSTIKKVITITTGFADDALTNQYSLYEAAPYSISKAAVNTAVAKYNAKLGRNTDERILFLAISPGVVATSNQGLPPPDSRLPQKFMEAYPHWKGPITPEESVKAMMAVVDRATVDSEFAGGFVSHFGNKEWL